MSDKPHKPTPKKLKDARKKGEVAKSKEVISLALFVATLLFMWLGATFIGEQVFAVIEHAIGAPQSVVTGAEWPWLPEMQAILLRALWILAPMFAIGLACALLVGSLQTRGLFSLEAISPKFERINPGKGLSNLFSTRQLFELGKMLVKTTLLTGVLVASLWFSLDSILKMVYASPAELLHIVGVVVLGLMGWAVLVYVISAALDYAHQYHEFMKQQKMSTDEMRREWREMEGDPYIKANRRATGREMAMAEMVSRTATANVVIANPTHVSVALYYKPGTADLPRVVAKGVDAIALRIRTEAERHGVPVYENIQLARQVFREVPLDQYISDELIDAIAGVFRWAKTADRRGSAVAPP